MRLLRSTFALGGGCIPFSLAVLELSYDHEQQAIFSGHAKPPRLEGLWRHAASEKEPTLDECNEATESLWSHVEAKYRVGSGDWDDLFLRGDFLGDRSQVLEIVYPPAITPVLFEHLGKWVASRNPQWRVIVPTFLGHREAFVVYPEGVRHRSGLSMPSEDVCKEIALQLLKRSQFAHALERATEEGWKW